MGKSSQPAQSDCRRDYSQGIDLYLNESDKVNFTDVLNNAVNKVNDSQVKANNDIEALIKGDDITMHEVMLSTQEAQISMQLMLEMRNKLYDAYKELSSVQL